MKIENMACNLSIDSDEYGNDFGYFGNVPFCIIVYNKRGVYEVKFRSCDKLTRDNFHKILGDDFIVNDEFVSSLRLAHDLEFEGVLLKKGEKWICNDSVDENQIIHDESVKKLKEYLQKNK